MECGTAARTRIVRPPSWRLPVAAVAVLVLLAGAGIALAFVEVTNQGQKPAAAAPTGPAVAPAAAATTTTPAPAASATSPTATAPTTTPAQTATSPTPSAAAPKLLSWPKGKAAYTVILLSTSDHATATKTAKALAKAAAVVGLARSDAFTNIPAGSWLVFAGRYQDHAKAAAAAAAAKQHGGTSAYVQYLTAKR